MKTFLAKVQEQYNLGLPFVLYSFPESDEIEVLFQKNKKKYTSSEFSEDGFVFAPFAAGAPLLIPAAQSKSFKIRFSEEIETQLNVDLTEDGEERQDYKDLVTKARNHILDGDYSKIVTSRRKSIPVNRFNLTDLISRLFALYPKAFRYVWYHPISGIWCGATPEVLVKTKGKEFSTMALAGTATFHEDKAPNWTQKEIDEQKWVVEAIANKLQRSSSVVKVSKIRNHRAGSLVHLRTDFNGVFKKNRSNLALLVGSLHPTPAVCGTPDQLAKQFIIENEDYDRAFYTGFLGPIHTVTKEAQLFVNLRCMQVLDMEANLFVGGGITADSDPEAEWKETQNKLQTMLQVIAPMLSNPD